VRFQIHIKEPLEFSDHIFVYFKLEGVHEEARKINLNAFRKILQMDHCFIRLHQQQFVLSLLK